VITTHLHCACERVHLDLERAPIITAECHCTSCRTAGATLQAVPGMRPLLEPNGGTLFVLYRKDRVRIVAGAELLREFRLSASTTTRRVVASCCMTPLFLEFLRGHWLSMYAGLWPEASRPAPELRTMTSDLPDASVLPDDLPNSKRQSPKFMFKLVGAWIAMGFRVPKIEVPGDLRLDP
jgi:hypothetical protein